MAFLGNQFYRCKFYERMPNANDPSVPFFEFNAEVLGSREKTYSQRISSMITPSTKQVIRTTSELIYEQPNKEEVRGWVEVQGVVYMVERMEYDQTTQSGLGAGRFSKEHNERNAIKILWLM